ncbi:MAG: peptide chain release factor N(5)-glutamine methyltransferase [Candidatus Omnitrophota bacterium]
MVAMEMAGATATPRGLLSAAARYIDLRDAEILLSYMLRMNRAELYADQIALPTEKIRRYERLVKERFGSRPLQYILGSVEFMGLDMIVDEGALIPRPETELLVKQSVAIINKIRQPAGFAGVRVLDLCTGCGVVAISLTKIISDCKIMSSDISPEALDLARRNARVHCVSDRITFLHSDLFERMPAVTYDLIIANPPYIASAEIARLQPELRFEPRQALDGGPDGLAIHRRIIAEAPAHLAANGYVALEIGHDQAGAIESLFLNRGFDNIEHILDDNNIKRVVTAQWID